MQVLDIILKLRRFMKNLKINNVLFVSIGLSCSFGVFANLSDYSKLLSSLKKADKIYLLCETTNNKYIALYGQSNHLGEPISLYYAFGKGKKIELQYPNQKVKNTLNQFQYNDYSRPLTHYTTVSFKNYSYWYEIGSFFRVDEVNAGVNVSTDDGKTISEVDCKNIYINQLNEIISSLSCREEQALGCGNLRAEKQMNE